ncbi:hypothetical protein [Photobacterium alginatilyticum]|uniref:Uncharacterized protein n=1 Tax=Photobacterium alginatilyticum TaxID=1775171 RepID=A0ABW9YNL4_9GAMM|nr:hypothetical protein [Photobacterium alginatilyticum]NBI55467.1 hypothetical protein [Photobacterium alginatilyticum]
MKYSDLVSQKGLFKYAYRAERAASNDRASSAHTALFLGINFAYAEAMPELMLTRLFKAIGSANKVAINKRKPDFEQSEKLTAALEKFHGVEGGAL